MFNKGNGASAASVLLSAMRTAQRSVDPCAEQERARQRIAAKLRPAIALDRARDLLEGVRGLDRRADRARLAIEAIQIATEREDDEGLASIDRACRAVLDRGWQPVTIRDPSEPEAGEWPAEMPSVLRPREAHRLLSVECDAAMREIASGDLSRAYRAARRVCEVLARYPDHFGGGDEEAAMLALLDAWATGAGALGRVLRAWGAPPRVVKHAQKSILR